MGTWWWIGPTIGAIGVIIGWFRARQVNARLSAIQDGLTRRAIEEPDKLVREFPRESGMSVYVDALERGRRVAPGVGAVQDTSNIGADLADQMLRDAFAEAISSLPEREKLIVTLYYYDGLTLNEIAQVLGLSEPRVSELRNVAVLELQSHLADRWEREGKD